SHSDRPSVNDLAVSCDHAVLHPSLRIRKPLWLAVLGVLQIVLALAAVIGLGWLGAVGFASWLQLPAVPTVDVGPFATPFLLLVGGLLAGLLLAVLARWMARIGARRRARTVERRLRQAIGEVADE